MGPVVVHPDAYIAVQFDHDPAPGQFETWDGWRRPALNHFEDGHRGIDIAAPEGSLLLAPFDGDVTVAAWKYVSCPPTIGGKHWEARLEIRRVGYAVRYYHMWVMHVVEGQTVKRGSVVGFVGSTGCATGPHVHVELDVLSEPRRTIDPLGYLDEYPSAFACTGDWGFPDINERLDRDKCRWAIDRL